MWRWDPQPQVVRGQPAEGQWPAQPVKEVSSCFCVSTGKAQPLSGLRPSILLGSQGLQGIPVIRGLSGERLWCPLDSTRGPGLSKTQSCSWHMAAGFLAGWIGSVE